MKAINSYVVYDEQLPQEILYYAVAYDEDHVKELAEEAGYDIEDMVIELERTNVKDQLGWPCSPRIEDARMR